MRTAHGAQPSAAEILARAQPGAVVNYTSFALHQVTVERPDGMKVAAFSSLWTWFTTDQRKLPAAESIRPDMPIVLEQVQPELMFHPLIVMSARLPWAHGQPPPPALMPPQQAPWWRKLIGGPR